MKNRNRPFFYEKKKTPFWKILLSFLCIAAILVFTGLQIPSVRQIIVEPLYASVSFISDAFRHLFELSRMYHEPETKRKTYDPIELPDPQVLFAESLENLSEINQEDPLADLRQTPTPSEYSRVAVWEYLDPELNYEISAGASSGSDQVISQQLIPPVFEHADLFNDGAAILSALLRYWGYIENQYQIANFIHPDPLDPFISFDDINQYITANYEELMVVVRLNGDAEILNALLKQNIPVLILVLQQGKFSFWLQDDHQEAHYLLILGYNSNDHVYYYQDTNNGNTLEISEEDLLSCWYPYQRQYMLVYPLEKDAEVRQALLENYYEELNLQRAMNKFRTDSEKLSDNPYTNYNYALTLHRDGDNSGAWNYFQNALDLDLPQRYFNYQQDILQTALELGYADDLETLIRPGLNRNSHDEILTLYLGWADILRGNYKKGAAYFFTAEKINPDSEAVRYALRYNDTMINY